jgi:transposase InsO family protein
MAEETVLYGNQLQTLFSFLEGTSQLRQLLKELLPLGFRELIKEVSLQGNSASLSMTMKRLPPNGAQPALTSSLVSANSGHSSSTGPRNDNGEIVLQDLEQPRRRRRNGSCSRGARPYAPAAEVWRRRQNPKIRGGGTLNLDSVTHDPCDWAKVIATSGTCHISDQGPEVGDGSFRQILEQCMRQGCGDIALSFQTMIAHIKLAINIQR